VNIIKNKNEMDTKIYSKQVCGLLAQQLVTEQAEVLKHQAVVESIRKTIVEKKKEIIKRIVNDNFFRFNGIRYSALNLSIGEGRDIVIVSITFGAHPEVIDWEEKLTRREAELLKEYSENYDKTIDYNGDEYGKNATRAANELKLLKNHIDLLKFHFFTIDISEAVEPEFFEGTGLIIRGRMGARYLEDYIAK